MTQWSLSRTILRIYNRGASIIGKRGTPFRTVIWHLIWASKWNGNLRRKAASSYAV